MKIDDITEPFKTAVLKIKELEEFDGYMGAFIFGSVARGEEDENSDLDIKVITKRKNYCKNVNHPFINSIKLDLSFNTLKLFKEGTRLEMTEKRRVPMIAESIIIFDKSGELKRIKQKALKSTPKKLKKKDYQWSQFMLYHMDNKAVRHLKSDPASSILSMGMNLKDALKDHYKINRRWWVSDKRLLNDLREWDPDLVELLNKFAVSSSIANKYRFWSQVLDHISKPIGGRKKIEEINCDCKLCISDMKKLQSVL